jgi:hypothetical protein
VLKQFDILEERSWIMQAHQRYSHVPESARWADVIKLFYLGMLFMLGFFSLLV